MPYVTSIERLAREEGQREGHREGLREGQREGQREGIESLLKVRFGDEGLKLMPEVREVQDEAILRAVIKALGAGATLDEVRRLWMPGNP